MLIKIALIISVTLTVWSMVEIVSPKLIYRIYQKIGILQLSEKTALKLIRIDGVISWLAFSILTGYLYGKL
jgi:hypothetical protein